MSPPRLSPDQRSGETIALADVDNRPLIALAIARTGRGENTIIFHVYHYGMDCTFVTLRIHSHNAHEIATRLRSLLNENAADCDTGQSGEVEHRSVSVLTL